MEKIVEEVLLAEEQAKILLEKARQQATKLKSDVELEIAEKLKQAREQAQESLKTGIINAKAAAAREYKTIILQIEEANSAFIQTNREKICSIVDKITLIITTPEFNRE